MEMKHKAIEFDFGQTFLDEIWNTVTNDAGELLMPEVAQMVITEMKKDIVTQIWVHLWRLDPIPLLPSIYYSKLSSVEHWNI